MAKSDNVYQHFRPEEQLFIEKSLDIISQVESNYAFQTLGFCNPREVAILTNLVGQTDLSCFVSTTYYDTEYAKVIIAPEYYELDMSDFEITVLQFSYNSKFNQITHRQVLGTLLNQLGVQRSLLGDILIGEGCVQLVVQSGMASYVSQSITKIGKVSVKWKEVLPSELLPRIDKGKPIEILVASLRIDSILSEILRLSRNNSIKLIEKDKVRLNYASILKASQEVVVGDLLSIRGYGRYIISEHNGFTKSGKNKLIIEKIIET